MTGHEFFLGYWWIFPLVMIAFCVLFAGRGYGETLYGFRTRERDGADESSLDILDRRFAEGEIDEQEYERKKQVLTRY